MCKRPQPAPAGCIQCAFGFKPKPGSHSQTKREISCRNQKPCSLVPDSKSVSVKADDSFPMVGFLEADGELDSGAKNMPLLCSQWESVWGGWGVSNVIQHTGTLVSAPQVTGCFSSDRPCRMENYSSLKPSPNTICTECMREMVCVYSGDESHTQCEYCYFSCYALFNMNLSRFR